MESTPLRPLARYVEPIPFEHDGMRFVQLHDPLRYSDGALSVSLPAFILMTMMDGQTTLETIRAEFNANYNAGITIAEIASLVKDLDKQFLLSNGNFEAQKKKLADEFAAQKVRPSSLAGKSYPADPAELSALLNGFLKEDGGPAPFAIVAPHIDLHAGGAVFGAAYARLKHSTAETFVILAIGHALDGDFFACIDKDFQTPLGASPVDRAFLSGLEAGFGEPLFANAYAHKNEHSAEFQVLLLQKLFAGQPARKVVPILFSFPETIEDLDHPAYNKQRVDRFIRALRTEIKRRPGKICLIAGVDLSHIGRRFNQEEGAAEQRLQETETDDRNLLRLVAEGNKPEFVRFMKETNPRNNVCGFPALYVLLDLLDGRKGELLDYRQNVEPDTDSMVSFAAMSFPGAAGSE
ncbi:MAG: AmmeMemoRadiSam system protein B [Nitrospinae bacterium]|nr:AmmeMemoRadiSam system protein B [Nitrospinota bacterium]